MPENLKKQLSFILTVTNTKLFENALLQPEEFENAGFSISCAKTVRENGAFEKYVMITDYHVISLTAFFKITRGCYVFKSLQRSAGTENM